MTSPARTGFSTIAALLLTCVSGTILANPARAETYPWVPVGADDIRVVPDVRIEIATRLELIRRAKRTIDIAVYEQSADKLVGAPILTALREAADRGVKIRFLTAWIAQMAKDPAKHAANYLTNPPAREPIQFQIFGGFKYLHQGGWRLDDSVHEKIMVVDDEVVLSTGRGHSKGYLKWLDTSFVLRGGLVAQTAEAVDKLWTAARAEGKLFVPKHPKPAGAAIEKFATPPSLLLSEGEKRDYAGLFQWLDQPASAAPATARGRVLHFDLIGQFQALQHHFSGTILERAKRYQDPIIAAMVERIDRGAREVRMTTLSTFMHPLLKEALIRAADRGTKVIIQTNGPHAMLDPFNMPFQEGLPDANELTGHPNVHIYGLQPGGANPFTFVHRKLAIIDETVIFGSHNLNLPSSTNNDELSFEVEDESYAAPLRTLFDQDVARTSVELSHAEIVHRLHRTGFLRWVAGPFIGTF